MVWRVYNTVATKVCGYSCDIALMFPAFEVSQTALTTQQECQSFLRQPADSGTIIGASHLH